MEAVKRWEPKLGPRFGTYAAYWIRAYVLRFLMTNSRLIHVGNTRAGRKLFFRLEKERQKLLAAGHRRDAQAAGGEAGRRREGSGRGPPAPGIARGAVRSAARAKPAAATRGIALSERMSGGGESPEVEAARAELATTMQELVAGFRDSLTDARERAVWNEHLAADEPVALGVLGARFGVSKQRMGQIADQLKKRFRAEHRREARPRRPHRLARRGRLKRAEPENPRGPQALCGLERRCGVLHELDQIRL